MGKPTYIPITGSVLSWAIDESGYDRDLVAHSLDIDKRTLQLWEKEELKPTLSQFRVLYSFLKRPSATFFLSEPPKSLFPAIKFRSPSAHDRSELNPTELRYIREIARLQRNMSWLNKKIGEKPINIPKVASLRDTEDLAKELRVHFNIPATAELKLRDSYKALKYWRGLLEEHGIFTYFLSLGPESCRGFSIWDDYAPAIVVNTKWNYASRIYSIFHELAHLVSRTNSACLRPSNHIDDVTERWCEKLAAAILMPWSEIKTFITNELGFDLQEKITSLDPVKEIAEYFNVSLRAATIRLIDKKLADWALYHRILPAADDKEGGGFGQKGRHRGLVKESQYGVRTTDVIVKGLDKRIINNADAVRILDMPYSHVDELRHKV